MGIALGGGRMMIAWGGGRVVIARGRGRMVVAWVWRGEGRGGAWSYKGCCLWSRGIPGPRG